MNIISMFNSFVQQRFEKSALLFRYSRHYVFLYLISEFQLQLVKEINSGIIQHVK